MPACGNVGQPNLYHLRLRATGAGMDDEYAQGFGFREFWVAGRELFLNGTPIRLRQGCFYWGARPQVGENYWEVGNHAVDTRGDATDANAALDDADRKGYLAGQYVLDAGRHVMDARGGLVWEQNRDHALERAKLWMRHYRHHPSLVIWIAGFNFFGSAIDQDPRLLGRRGWDAQRQRWQRLLAAGHDMFARLRELDPTRAYYSHAGAYTGDIYTINCYLDLIPLQEREDWLSEWAKTGEMPVSMVEFGTPMDCTFRRGRDGFTTNITTEPLLTEFSCIYFGNAAYAAEEPRYRSFLRDLFRGGMLYGSSENRLDEFANMRMLQRLYRTHTWRSWRTAGLPGGVRTWSWIQDALQENNGPTLAWIAGRPGQYTAKDHHFAGGETLAKQIALINDARDPQDFTATWTATVDGRAVGAGTVQGRLGVSEIRQVPIEAALPAQGSGARGDGRLDLTCAIGGTPHRDTFALRVYGPEPARRGLIAVAGPDGPTHRMLEDLGYSTWPWSGQAAPLVVVARNALRDDPAIAAGLEAYVRAGGRALVCAQDPAWLEAALGWRVCPAVTRRVFPLDPPFSPGIDADDLRDWTGDSTLIEAYPKYEGHYRLGNEGAQPYAGWHWGNRGGVSSAAVEKPHRSGWRPLLECEFDLAYTPLMELDYGRGRLTVCTLDLEDHVAADPAARRVAGRILDHVLHAPLSPRESRVTYVGGEGGAAWLDRIGVAYVRAAGLAPAVGLTLVGAEAEMDIPGLTAYLEGGGKVFFLPRAQADGPLGVRLQAAGADFAGALSPPDWPEAAGLSASDLRWRTHLDGAPWVVDAGAEIGADGLIGRKVLGKGVAIHCQVDPDRFQADERTYFRYTRWRSTRAVAQILANLGATFPGDLRVFHPADPTVFDLEGAWQVQGTLALPAAASDAGAHPDPGISTAARGLVGETAPGGGWVSVRLPGMLAFFAAQDGEAVFRKEIDIPAATAGRDMALALGILDDFDTTYFNGVEVGHTDMATPRWWEAPRDYRVPGDLVKAGRNVIAVRLFDRFNEGGFGGNRGLPMSLRPVAAGATYPGAYCPDYRTDFFLGDDPYRYYRW